MSSAKLTVSVYDGSRLVETLSDRPVRLTPDGKAGVVYAGEVYPVYSDNSISLDVRPIKKSLCYSFLSPGAKIPYAGRRGGAQGSAAGIARWYLESNRFGHYIVFDGSRQVASDLVTRLRSRQITVIRWDESVRSADNGETYDWFIRLDYDGTAEQCRQAVAPLVGNRSGADSPEESTADSVARSSRQAVEAAMIEVERGNAIARARTLELLAEQSKQLEDKAQAEAARAKKFETQVARLKRQLAEQRTANAAEVAQLREHVAMARTERDKAESNASTTERMDQVLAAKASAEADWVEAQEDADALRAERDSLVVRQQDLADEMELKDQRIEQLSGEVAELEGAERERRARRQGTSPQGGSFEDFLSRALNRLALDPDDLDLLLSWPSPREALQVLMEINAGGRPRHGKPVERNQGWTEVAGINTGRKGSENMGRIYFRRLKTSDRVRVCLHDKQDKKEQSRFIDRLPEV
jgi:hypothetical protein